MKIRIIIFLLLFIGIHAYCQTDTTTGVNDTSKRSCFLNKYPPHIDRVNDIFVYRNQQAPLSRKLLRGTVFVLGADALSFGVLYYSPESFSKWDHHKMVEYKTQYKNTFTQAPVTDHDYWYINYLGHPYQGAYMYNGLRSQGATVLQSGLFTIAHSCLWEYAIEGGVEQPSVQDLIVTPIGGLLLGELCHQATVKMSKNGFKWYEVAFVCVFNPAYALNNGFKFAKPSIQ